MKHVVAKFILQLLLPEQKEHGAAVAIDLIPTATNEPDFLKEVIMGDESWVYGCDPEMKAQSFQWKSPGPPHLNKVHQHCSKMKTMLTVFFDWKVVVHREANQLIRSSTSMFFIY